VPIECQIAHFINNQQITVCYLLFQLQQPMSVQRLYQFVGKIGRRVEPDIHSLHTGLETQGNGQVRFPGSGIAYHNHILLLFNEVTAGKLADLRLRHMLQIGEVKLLQRLGIRKPCGADFTFPKGRLWHCAYLYLEWESRNTAT